MTAIEIIGTTITPIVVINAIGLLGLVIQNRYSRVKDRIYGLLEERKVIAANSGERASKIVDTEELLKKYLTEAKLIKNSMIYAFLSIVFIVITCFLMMITSYLFEEETAHSLTELYGILEVTMLVAFCCGLILLLMCVLTMSRSLVMSINTVSFEIHTEYIHQ